MNFSRLRLGIGLVIVLGIATAAAGLAQFGASPETPLPPATPVPTASPAPPAATASPAADTGSAAPGATASPGGRPRRGRRAPGPSASGSPGPGPSPSETPEPPQFTTLDGIWEIEMQPLGRRLAVYSHLSIATTGATISGYWEHDPRKTRTPMTGTFDGRLISMTVAMPDGTTASFSGYVENFADMVGLFRAKDTDPGLAFTAEHRKKLK